MGMEGETPRSGHGSHAGISTSAAAAAGSGPQPLLIVRSSGTSVDEAPMATAPHTLSQDMDPNLVRDGVISPSAPPTELPLSSPSSPSSSSPPSTFLSLPLEIRLEIYAHLLTTPSSPPRPFFPPSPEQSSPNLSPSSSSSSSPAPYFNQQTAPPPLHPNILRTCRQLHAECIPVLYTRNIFNAHTTLLTVFPSLFSPSHPRKTYTPIRSAPLASLVTRFRMRLRLDAEPQFARDAVTAQFSGKQELVIEAWQTEWRGAGPEALRLFEDVRGVRVARVVGSTSGFEDYARWLERAMMAGVGEYVAPFSPRADGAVRGQSGGYDYEWKLLSRR